MTENTFYAVYRVPPSVGDVMTDAFLVCALVALIVLVVRKVTR